MVFFVCGFVGVFLHKTRERIVEIIKGNLFRND